MYGYVYITTNTITGEIYIGKRTEKRYRRTYYGSGKAIKAQIAQYGKNAFKNEMLAIAESKDELNRLEKAYIQEHIEKYGSLCLNIAFGGDGGDTISRKTDIEKAEFVNRMTVINRKRCATTEFKNRISEAGKKRYSDPAERTAQAERSKKALADPKVRKQLSESHRKYYETHKKDVSYMEKPCIMELNGEILQFKSVKELRTYLISKYDYNPDRRTFKKLMIEGEERIPFKPFHKNKLSALAGMMIYYDPAGRKCRGQG